MYNIKTFDIIPQRHPKSNRIMFTEITYEINNPDVPISDVDLIVDVWLDDKLMETINVLSINELEKGLSIGSQEYVPASMWKKGVYTFKATLYANGEIYSNTIEKKLEITKNTAPKVISWGILGIIIITMLPIIVITVFMVLRRRRHMFSV